MINTRILAMFFMLITACAEPTDEEVFEKVVDNIETFKELNIEIINSYKQLEEYQIEQGEYCEDNNKCYFRTNNLDIQNIEGLEKADILTQELMDKNIYSGMLLTRSDTTLRYDIGASFIDVPSSRTIMRQYELVYGDITSAFRSRQRERVVLSMNIENYWTFCIVESEVGH